MTEQIAFMMGHRYRVFSETKGNFPASDWNKVVERPRMVIATDIIVPGDKDGKTVIYPVELESGGVVWPAWNKRPANMAKLMEVR